MAAISDEEGERHRRLVAGRKHMGPRRGRRRGTAVDKCRILAESKWEYLLPIWSNWLLVAAVISSTVGANVEGLVINVGLRANKSGRNLTRRWATADFGAASSSSPRSGRLLEVEALVYLQRYGYMNGTQNEANQLISEDSFNEAVMSFQRFAGIPETGRVDSLTVKYMQMPRCGNKDRSGRAENGKRRRRRKRYALQGSKWRRQELTYRISQYPTRFQHKKEQVDAQIERAFRIWSDVAPIEFVVKKEGRVHIDIRFASGEHGDGDPFDGPGNTLAHAYFPQYGGDAHFDDQEYWTVDSYAGTNIFQVAAHELGHSLGLGHSSVREALMAPFYQKYKPNFRLHADDVLAIQALYGEKSDGGDSSSGSSSTTSTTTTTTTTTTTEEPSQEPAARRRPARPSSTDGDDQPVGKPVDLCQDTGIDAITRTEDGNTYLFRGQYYWQLKPEGLAGVAQRISRDWSGLPGNLDAALTWSDGKTFFFKGDKYWRFHNKRREPGYPKLISAGFAGIPNNVDTAFVWSGNGKTYFFKRDKYWRFDSKQEPPVSSQYPKPLKNWVGLPATGIDAALKWDNGMTYFFKNDLYYRFDDRQFEVDTSARPQFPRSTAEWWLGCTNSNLPLVRHRPDGADGSVDDDRVSAEALDESASNLLLYHRRPTSNYERPQPTGTSFSRSLLAGLNNIFGSSSSSSSSPKDSSDSNDWAFAGTGMTEELRRRRHRSRETERHKPSGLDTSRWSFPMSGSGSNTAGGVGEQSLSELRAAPSVDHELETDDLKARRRRRKR